MPTSPTSFVSEIINGNNPIPQGKLAYFQERQRNKLYDIIVGKFLEKQRDEGFSKADLARRINKNPAQITRWLSTPSNWTLDTVSDLMLAICGGELSFSISKFADAQPRNATQLDVLSPSPSVVRAATTSSANTIIITTTTTSTSTRVAANGE